MMKKKKRFKLYFEIEGEQHERTFKTNKERSDFMDGVAAVLSSLENRELNTCYWPVGYSLEDQELDPMRDSLWFNR